MKQHVAGYQCDMFGEPSPILLHTPLIEPLPDPSYWSAAIREKMADALIDLACDSRRGDKMPESLMDCADLLSERLRHRRIDAQDYYATLGWIMEYWLGAVPYDYVCRVNGVDPETLQYVVTSTPLLARDLEEVRSLCFGTLI